MLLLSFHQGWNSSNSLSFSRPHMIFRIFLVMMQVWELHQYLPLYKLLSIVTIFFFSFSGHRLCSSPKLGFCWILMSRSSNCLHSVSSFKRILSGPLLHFPKVIAKTVLQGLELLFVNLAFTVVLNWSLLKMDFDLPWGSILNSDPRTRFFKQSINRSFASRVL